MKGYGYRILILLVFGCGGEGQPSMFAPPPPPTLAVVSGDGQQGTSSQVLGAFVVRVIDAGGSGVAGVPVLWSVLSGVGEFAAPAANSRTGSDGVATMSFRPTVPGQVVVVRAEVPGAQGSPATFTANVIGGPVVVLIRFAPVFDCSANDPSRFLTPAGDIQIGSLVEFEYMDWLHSSCTARVRSLSVPPGAAPFDSGIMGPGQRAAVLVSVVGDWKFADVIGGGEATLRVR